MKLAGDPGGRIPSLDGLRAISILLVIFAHLTAATGSPLPESIADRYDLGQLGVRVFFVISGYLITTLLLREHKKTGTISLKKFYYRRTLRIFPTYYLMLGCITALVLLDAASEVSVRDLVHAVTYTTNYEAQRAPVLAHTWSLAVEEQFYLLWPAIFLFVRPRFAVRIAAFAMLAVPIYRLYFGMVSTGHVLVASTFGSTADMIATGCVLAGWRDELHGRTWYLRLIRSPLLLALPIVVLGINMAQGFFKLYWLVGISVQCVCIALIIDAAMENHDSAIGKVLNWRPLVLIGTWSYSLYLWQQVFLDPANHSVVATFPQNLVFVFAAGVVSYYAIEKPLLRMRERWEPRLFPRRTTTQ
ncbi:MAG TPA: acyltransferase [Kofleriaceae bacterium]